MLRLAEIGLLLTPLGLFLLWRFLAPHVRPAVLWIGLAIVAALAATTITYGLRDRMDPHTRYIPAHLEGTTIVPGHSAP